MNRAGINKHNNCDVQSFIERSGKSLVNISEHGETIMHLLLVTAYIEAVEAEERKQEKNMIYSRGCMLKGLSKHLYSQSWVEVILSSKLDNMVEGKTFGEAFKDVINYSDTKLKTNRAGFVL